MKLSIALAVASAGCSIVGTTLVTSVATAQTVRDLDSHEHGSAILNIAVDTNALFLELDTPWNNLVGFEHEPGTDEQWAQVSEAWALLNQPERLFALSGGNCIVSEVRAESAMPIEPHDAEHDDDKHEHEDKEHDEHGHDEDHDKHDDGHSDDEHKDDEHKDHGDEGHDKHDDGHSDDEHKDDEHKDHGDEDHDKHDDGHSDDEHKHDDKDHDDDGHSDSDHDKHDDDEHHAHDHEDEETHSTALVSYSYSCSDIAQLSSINVNLFTLWSGFEELDVQLIGPGGQTATELNASTSSINISDVQ